MHSKHFTCNMDLLRKGYIGLLKLSKVLQLSKVKSQINNKSKGGTLTS